jgi:hypothetical protein
VDRVSGHSSRVGGAQDLAALDSDLASITQARGDPLECRGNMQRRSMRRDQEWHGRRRRPRELLKYPILFDW